MEIDKTTLTDLSIFSGNDDFSVFQKINLCSTIRGEEQLELHLSKPLVTLKNILDAQDAIRYTGRCMSSWPSCISNGTLMVVERFFESRVDALPAQANPVTAASYKVLHTHDYTLVKYSVNHVFDFVKGFQQIVDRFLTEDTPALVQEILLRAQKIMDHRSLDIIKKNEKAERLSPGKMLQLAHFILAQFKSKTYELLELYAKLDAYKGMATAIVRYNLCYPTFENNDQPVLEAEGLYHILLKEPVPYDVLLNKDTNFLFLTGANMAGKSTFIKAVGSAVFLAHTGMGVPAKSMRLTVFDGLLSNINVIDNIAKGESYFYNEVQRIKSTVQKVSDGRKWLILIDELFKGTNIEDAMKCSVSVIEGLIKIKNSLFILSTHLYEIHTNLQQHSNIHFNYFETEVVNGQLYFNYQLRDGVSNDRLGYLILKNEGVVELLENL